MPVFEWGELRHFLAVAEAGTSAGAARLLETSQPTTVRRIAALEQAIGLTLFERHANGYRLTADGEALLPLARSVADAVGGFEAGVAIRSRQVGATLRVSCGEAMVVHMMPVCARFRQRFPATRVEMSSSNRFVDVARGEADLVLRAGHGVSDEGLYGMRLPDAHWMLFASADYLAARGGPASFAEISDHAVIGAEGPIAETPPFHWLAANVAPGAIVWRGDVLSSIAGAIRAGLGIGPLPCIIGLTDPQLRPVLAPIEGVEAAMYVLTAPALRLVPEVKHMMELVRAHFEGQEHLLTGRLAHGAAQGASVRIHRT